MLSDVLGMFVVNTNAIYILNTLDSCRQQSVLAHDLTHFFQNYYEEQDTSGFYDIEKIINQSIIHQAREEEAYRIGDKFSRLFCDEGQNPDYPIPNLIRDPDF